MHFMNTCEYCGERVYALGCVNCNEAAYIEEQEMLTELLYPADDKQAVAKDGQRNRRPKRSVVRAAGKQKRTRRSTRDARKKTGASE